MEKIRHLLCICYAPVIQLASIALKYVQTMKKGKNGIILLRLPQHM